MYPSYIFGISKPDPPDPAPLSCLEPVKEFAHSWPSLSRSSVEMAAWSDQLKHGTVANQLRPVCFVWPYRRGSVVKGGLREKSSVWATAVPGVCRMTLLLLASGYLGLRIMALEAQLKSLGALTELLLRSTEWVGVHSSLKEQAQDREAQEELCHGLRWQEKKNHQSGSNRFGWHCFKKPSYDTSDTQVVLQVDRSSERTWTDKRLHSSKNTPSLTNPL